MRSIYREIWLNRFMIAYFIVQMVSFLYLTFFDGYGYTWWNWIILVPLNFFVSTIWPIYWGLLRWVI